MRVIVIIREDSCQANKVNKTGLSRATLGFSLGVSSKKNLYSASTKIIGIVLALIGVGFEVELGLNFDGVVVGLRL